MKQRVPSLRTDEEAEEFLNSDLSNLDFSQFKSGRLRFEEPPASETYRLFEEAMMQRKQVVCVYKGIRRELCPIMLGHSQGEERALTYQFAGGSTSKLPAKGNWRCLTLSNVTEVQLREGPWHDGDSHAQVSHCVEIVDLDVNPNSPYDPKRPLPSTSAAKPQARRDKGRRAGASKTAGSSRRGTRR